MRASSQLGPRAGVGMLAGMSAAQQPIAAASFADTAGVRVASADEWDPLVARLGGDDVYLRRDYHVASAHLEPGGARPVLLHCTGDELGAEVALPLLVRPLPTGTGFDATSAYGYGGPTSAAPTQVDVAELGTALDEWMRANDVVATFLRFHPLLGNARLAPANATTIELGATVAWDVSPGRELLPAMHSHHRRAARKADRAGLVTRVTVGPESLDGFRATYDETMRRQEADDFYFFPDAYWESMLATGAGGELVLVEGLLDDEPVAAQLCFAHGPWLHYHLGASADAARAIGASNRCFLAAAEWAQSRGMERFHLGGGVGGGTESPLFVFKHRYDPTSEPYPFHVAKLVHDADAYRALAGTDSLDGFFPPWRRPA